MPATLDRLEQTLAAIVEQPLAQTLAALQGFADEEPQNPAPYLAMAMVSSFARNDFVEASKYLSVARRLLEAADVAGDVEMAFAQALYRTISAEFKMAAVARPMKGQIIPAQLMGWAEAEAECKAAFTDLDRAVRKVDDSTLAQSLRAMFLAFSRANGVAGKEYSQGVRALSRLRTSSKSPDLAAFFLIYAYRRAHRYPQALRIGQELEERNPNSPLAKRVVGSCYFFMQDFDDAERYYQQAMVLDPDDLSLRLELARVFQRQGKLVEAREIVHEVTGLDKAGSLSAFSRPVLESQEVREALSAYRSQINQ
jgi:tetratricopeptide (TPR) repeat protein